MRLFVAVEIDKVARARIAALIERLKKGGDPVKWVPPENLHLTIKFLGEAPDERLPDIEAACRRAAAGARSFSLRLRGMGAFPNARRPRVLWVGIDAPPPALRELVARTEAELAPLGFEREEREFDPHVTIGRIRPPHPVRRPGAGRAPSREIGPGLMGAIAAEAAFDAGTVAVAALTLMRSQLRPRGPIYTPVSRYPLCSGAIGT